MVVFRIEQANRIGGGAIGQEYKVAIAAPDIEKLLIGYTQEEIPALSPDPQVALAAKRAFTDRFSLEIRSVVPRVQDCLSHSGCLSRRTSAIAYFDARSASRGPFLSSRFSSSFTDEKPARRSTSRRLSLSSQKALGSLPEKGSCHPASSWYAPR